MCVAHTRVPVWKSHGATTRVVLQISTLLVPKYHAGGAMALNLKSHVSSPMCACGLDLLGQQRF